MRSWGMTWMVPAMRLTSSGRPVAVTTVGGMVVAAGSDLRCSCATAARRRRTTGRDGYRQSLPSSAPGEVPQGGGVMGHGEGLTLRASRATSPEDDAPTQA